MGTWLKQIGASGVVIDGHFRDIRETQELGIPVRVAAFNDWQLR